MVAQWRTHRGFDKDGSGTRRHTYASSGMDMETLVAALDKK